MQPLRLPLLDAVSRGGRGLACAEFLVAATPMPATYFDAVGGESPGASSGDPL